MKVYGGTAFELDQNVQHGVAVLTARHAHHDTVAVFNHVVVTDGLAHLAAQAFL